MKELEEDEKADQEMLKRSIDEFMKAAEGFSKVSTYHAYAAGFRSAAFICTMHGITAKANGFPLVAETCQELAKIFKERASKYEIDGRG